ncbi:hypothetical protein [Pandoravirus japonicus]|uniref:Uncharacterized protein n=1 Tax=Pandoravirus japonicus TaxID=2823154 RepID=A0A811BS90_9VIRU|nr:hypothetical protein [Pandoravirus japonicus]
MGPAEPETRGGKALLVMPGLGAPAIALSEFGGGAIKNVGPGALAGGRCPRATATPFQRNKIHTSSAFHHAKNGNCFNV